MFTIIYSFPKFFLKFFPLIISASIVWIFLISLKLYFRRPVKLNFLKKIATTRLIKVAIKSHAHISKTDAVQLNTSIC